MKLKYLWQRLTRGFSDEITWNLDKELAKWLLPRLKRFKELQNGYPPHLTPDEWQKTLDKIIRALEIELHQDEVRLWKMCTNLKEHEEKLCKEHQEGFELLGKYLSALWW